MKELSTMLQETLVKSMNPIIYKVEAGVITETRSYSDGLGATVKGRDVKSVYIPAIKAGEKSQQCFFGVDVFHTLEEAKTEIINNSKEWMQFRMKKFVVAKNELEKAMNGNFVIKQS